MFDKMISRVGSALLVPSVFFVSAVFSDQEYLGSSGFLGECQILERDEPDHVIRARREADEYAWPESRIVRYKITPNRVLSPSGFRGYYDFQAEKIRDALKDWSDVTCVQFQEVDYDTELSGSHLVFQNTGGCSSYVGCIGKKQDVFWGHTCGHSHRGIRHEIGHALGLWHHHSRPDRDFYYVLPKDISYSVYNQFLKVPGDEYQGTPYDYASVMHYATDAYSRELARPTERVKYALTGAGLDIGGDDISAVDAIMVNRMFRCHIEPEVGSGSGSQNSTAQSSAVNYTVAVTRDVTDNLGYTYPLPFSPGDTRFSYPRMRVKFVGYSSPTSVDPVGIFECRKSKGCILANKSCKYWPEKCKSRSGVFGLYTTDGTRYFQTTLYDNDEFSLNSRVPGGWRINCSLGEQCVLSNGGKNAVFLMKYSTENPDRFTLTLVGTESILSCAGENKACEFVSDDQVSSPTYFQAHFIHLDGALFD